MDPMGYRFNKPVDPLGEGFSSCNGPIFAVGGAGGGHDLEGAQRRAFIGESGENEVFCNLRKLCILRVNLKMSNLNKKNNKHTKNDEYTVVNVID